MGDYSGYVLIFVLILKALAVQVHCCSCHCPIKSYWFSPLFTDSNFLRSYLQHHPHHFVPPPPPIIMMPEQAPAPGPPEESRNSEVKTMEMTSMPMSSVPMSSIPMSSMLMPIMPMPRMEMYKVEEETKEPPPAPVIFESKEEMSEPKMKMEISEPSESMASSDVDNPIKMEQSHPPSNNEIKESDGKTDKDEDHHHDKNVYYMFQYAVNDEKTHDMKSQKEERKGDVVKGEYSLLEADGNVRTVKYYADWKSGFHADVHNSKKPAR